jgi:YD repeat-containing protein
MILAGGEENWRGGGLNQWRKEPSEDRARVQFEYVRYNSSGTLQGQYEGQVTRIIHPDGRNEYFGYTSAGELAWKRKGSGHVITVTTRDAQHRVTRTDYPATGSGGAFNVQTVYDEFGRVASSTDNTGATSQAYDLLDRPTSVVPPAPQKALTFTYAADTALKRWTTNMDVGGSLISTGTTPKGGCTRSRTRSPRCSGRSTTWTASRR